MVMTSDIAYDQRMRRCAKALSEDGWKVVVYHTGTDESCDFADDIRPIHTVAGSGFMFYALFNVFAFFKLLFVKTDIITCVDLDAIPATYLASRFRGKILVHDAHEYYVESPELTNRTFVKNFWTSIADFFLPRIENNYTVNESLKSILSKKYGKPYAVVRNCPDLYEHLSTDQKDAKIVLYQGVVNIGRGLKEAVLAMAQFLELKMIIAGGGDIVEEISYLIEKEKLGDRVTLAGKLQPEELRQLTSTAWIGLNLLDPSNKNYYYSLANKYLDYIMAEVPSLSMSFPEYVSINEEAQVSHLLENLSVQSVVNGISKLMDATYYQQLKDNCVVAREKYNWEKEKARLIDLYAGYF